MGYTFEANCMDCGLQFTTSKGGGFFFELFRCDTCGVTREVSHSKLGETFLRYIKGLPGIYSVATAERDKYIQSLPLEPLSEEDFELAVSKYLGKCKCGGTFLETAPVRCPRCFSTHIQEGEILIDYD